MARELTIFDDPENVNKVLKAFFATLVVLLILDIFVTRHAHFPWEEALDFYPVYGFVSCVLLVFIARGLRALVMREEDYYD
ncbi:MAG: hypothetical protein GXO65_00650 [Euryarchaeota archaeon]|nr:hypothetical protein [Euryarchaeota archaeon]